MRLQAIVNWITRQFPTEGTSGQEARVAVLDRRMISEGSRGD
jgi:hypothetical protein